MYIVVTIQQVKIGLKKIESLGLTIFINNFESYTTNIGPNKEVKELMIKAKN